MSSEEPSLGPPRQPLDDAAAAADPAGLEAVSEALFTVLAPVFMAGLIIFQLPLSPWERTISAFFDRFQSAMHVNRQYRMYSPNPRAAKNVPLLVVHHAGGEPRRHMLEDSDVLSLGLGLLSKEKWDGFLNETVKYLVDEDRSRFRARGRRRFTRLAEAICSRSGAKMVELRFQPVTFRIPGTAPAWRPPQALLLHRCTESG